MRFPILATLEKLKTEDFQNPEAVVQDKKLGEISITDDAVLAMLTQEAKAGRAVYLTVKAVDRLDGTFLIAGIIQPTGQAGQVLEPDASVGAGTGSGSGSGSESAPPMGGAN